MLWIEEPERFETLRLPVMMLSVLVEVVVTCITGLVQGLRRGKGLCSRVSAEGPIFGVWV